MLLHLGLGGSGAAAGSTAAASGTASGAAASAAPAAAGAAVSGPRVFAPEDFERLPAPRFFSRVLFGEHCSIAIQPAGAAPGSKIPAAPGAARKYFVKDVRRVCADLSRVVLLDNNASSWGLADIAHNGLHIQARRNATSA